MSAAGHVWRSVRRAWWFTLWGMRPAGRMFLARTGMAGQAVMLRSGWHWVFGNSFSLSVKAVLWLVFSLCPLPWCLDLDLALILTAVWAAAFTMIYQLAINGGAPSRLIMRYWVAQKLFGWKLAWRFRSRWPMEWAIPANKTRTVQAEVGTTSEATVTIRPIFDAPKVSWLPQIEWPVISWWVSPPPGRTFAEFETVLDVLASNIANVIEITLDYERASSSMGRMSVLFDDPLTIPVLPDDHQVDDLDDGEAFFDVIGDYDLPHPAPDAYNEAVEGVEAEVIDIRPRFQAGN